VIYTDQENHCHFLSKKDNAPCFTSLAPELLMKILHTSDWHLGRSLYGQKRYEEYGQFLDWLVGQLEQEQVDALLVAGDIFDTGTPSNRALELYYQFLCRVAASPCRHVIITAGNHDSPSLLNAPKEVLKFLSVHVVGSITDSVEDEVIVLSDKNGSDELVVCAVPYLRDRDIRRSEAGESLDDKTQKLLAGIKEHYEQVCAVAEQKQAESHHDIPIVAMGHLFTAGGKTVEGDGVRELYVGNLCHLKSDQFPECIDYLALGHLHVPQKVGGIETQRYCGSPLPVGFGEASQQKEVVVVDFTGTEATIKRIPVPVFQRLESIKGDLETITGRLKALVNEDVDIWLEVIYTGDQIVGNLASELNELVENSNVDILRIKNNQVIQRVLKQQHTGETLDDLNEMDVFTRRLDQEECSDEDKKELIATYQEILNTMHDEDQQAE
jgi:DNA repair protein SbcD/Mre11